MEQTENTITPQPKLYNNFLEKGKDGKNDWWRYVVGFAIVAGFYLLGGFPLQIFAIKSAMRNGHSVPDILDHQDQLTDPSYSGLSLNTNLALILFIFVSSMFGLWIVVRFLHKKKFSSIITSANKFRYKRFFTGFIVWLIINVALLLISLKLSPDSFHLVFQSGPFIGSLLVCLLMLPVQTWWEEFLMRGYLLQGLGLFSKRGLFPLIITSVCFGLLHMANQEVKCFGVAEMLPQYILPGLFFGMITLLDEGLELAMGLHLSNNLFGILTVTNSCLSVKANTIWSVNDLEDAGGLIALLIQFAVLFGILWFIYKWNFKKLYR